MWAICCNWQIDKEVDKKGGDDNELLIINQRKKDSPVAINRSIKDGHVKWLFIINDALSVNGLIFPPVIRLFLSFSSSRRHLNGL